MLMLHGLTQLVSQCSPRLCLHTILQEAENAVNVMAPICSSWGMPARSTSMRSFFNWQGQGQYPFVLSANIMVSRLLDLYIKVDDGKCVVSRTMYSLYRISYVLISLTVMKPPSQGWCFFAWSSLASGASLS